MKSLTTAVNRQLSVRMAAVFLGSAYLASRVLGLLRDRLLATHFGISPSMDAYTAAFRLPDLLFTLLASGAFAVAFIPVVTQQLQDEDRERAWRLTAGALNLLALVTLVGGLVIFAAAGPLISLITPGFDATRHDMAVHLTRIMAFTPLFFAIAGVLGSLQQSVGRFMVFAMAGILYNLGIIFGILVLAPTHSIYGVAYGVVLGAALQAGMQVLGLSGLGFRWRRTSGVRNPDVRRVLKLMLPRSIDEGIDQINYTIETVIGSLLAAGSLTAYYYANNLKNVPLVIFGSAIATAAFPALAAAAGQRDQLIRRFVQTVRLMLFVLVPAVVVTVLMRAYIVRLLFGFNNATTANTLGWFAGTILFQSLFFLVTRMYYSLQDTKTPLYTSLGAVVLNIGAAIGLGHVYGVMGLAMAQSLVAGLELAMLAGILRQRLGRLGLRLISQGLINVGLAAGVMTGVLVIMVNVLPINATDRGIATIGLKFAAIGAAGTLAYFIPCYILQLDEARELLQRLKNRAKTPI